MTFIGRSNRLVLPLSRPIVLLLHPHSPPAAPRGGSFHSLQLLALLMLTTLATLASRTSTELITDFTMLRHILKQPAKKLLADYSSPPCRRSCR